MNDLLGAVVAASLIKASNGFDKHLDFGGIKDFYAHEILHYFVIVICGYYQLYNRY